MSINTSLYMPLFDADVKLCTVRFHGDSWKLYTYKYEAVSMSLRVGDTVIVETRGWYTVATVVDPDTEVPIDNDDISYRWVVGYLDTDEHTQRLKYEASVVRRINRARADAARKQVAAAMGVCNIEELLALAAQEAEADTASVLDHVDEADVAHAEDDQGGEHYD